MATMAEISTAINQITIKKHHLHQSFLHLHQSFLQLQSQSPSSFNLPFNWSHIDSHFTTLQSSLKSKFTLLQTLSPTARPELKSFCKNSDGLGLIKFIAFASDRPKILSELPDAYRYAPDASAMVLDAMVAFYNANLEEDDLLSLRIGCLIMLEGLVRVNVDVASELKAKAMEMAVQWNQKRGFGDGNVKALGFVLLVGAYGLVDRFSIDDVTDCFLVVATYGNVIDLCRRIVPADKINDMIQKLIDNDMILTAVKFSIKLQKTREFPPGGLLEELKLRCMRFVEERHKNVKYVGVANAETNKGIRTLESIIKCVDENRLELEYSKDSVIELVNKVENEMKDIKYVKGVLRIEPPTVTVLQQQKPLKSKMLRKSKKRKRNKVQPTAEPAAATHVPALPELKSFCENSDGLGLMRFIALASCQRLLLAELPDAYQCAPDAPAMVLDAMVAFYSSDCKDTELLSFRSGCLVMLEGLLRVKPAITIELQDKAMEMAVQWNQMRVFCPCEQKALGFVLLVDAYWLEDRFSIDDITDCFLTFATYSNVIDLCRRIIPVNNIKHMIRKLIDKDMIVTAVKFSIELQKTDEFPPVGLLEELKLRSMSVMDERRRSTKYLDVWNAETFREISTLESIIKCIDENHLESVYSRDSLVELVNKLKIEMQDDKHVKRLLRKEPPRETLLRLQLLSESKASKKSKEPKLNKVKLTAESAAATPEQSVKVIQESHSQKSDVSPDQCHNSSRGSGPICSNASYSCPIASSHRSIRADIGYNSFAPRLHPPSDCNSNGWISE